MPRRIVLAALICCSPLAAAEPQHTYGDTLVDGLIAAHRDIGGIAIEAAGKDGTPIRIARGQLPEGRVTSLPLTNSMAEAIGTIRIAFRSRRHVAPAAVAYEASRRIYVASNLTEADPFVPGAVRSRAAQAIVDQMMARNPDLVTLGMHIGASGANNTILASNFGRIGKPGDKDDARVIDAGMTLKEPTNGGKRLAVSLPMLDRKGRVIGALSTSFVVGPDGPDKAAARAIAVRDAIARQIASLDQVSR